MKRLQDMSGYDVDNFILEVQAGNIEGAEIIGKFGRNDDVRTTPETIWEGQDLYPYPLDYGAGSDTINLVSSNGGDVSTIVVEGLDSEGSKQSEIITLTGTTPVTSANTWSRVFRAYNNSDTPLVGDVTITDTTGGVAAAIVTAESQQTLMSIYTIPKGYTGFIFYSRLSVGDGRETNFSYVLREFQKVFRVIDKIILFENTKILTFPYLRVEELTDFEVRGETTQGGAIADNFTSILLLDNSVWCK